MPIQTHSREFSRRTIACVAVAFTVASTVIPTVHLYKGESGSGTDLPVRQAQEAYFEESKAAILTGPVGFLIPLVY